MDAFPALYARLYPTTHNGFRVVCTATLRDLGTIAWRADGSTVTWQWWSLVRREASGERTTKRAAVQALRDEANAITRAPLLPFAEAPAPAPAPATPAPKRQRDEQPRRATRPTIVSRDVVWNDEPAAGDLTSAVADALRRERENRR